MQSDGRKGLPGPVEARRLTGFVAIATLFVALVGSLGGEWLTFGAYYYGGLSNNADLVYLEIGTTVLDPPFDPAITSYTTQGILPAPSCPGPFASLTSGSEIPPPGTRVHTEDTSAVYVVTAHPDALVTAGLLTAARGEGVGIGCAASSGGGPAGPVECVWVTEAVTGDIRVTAPDGVTTKTYSVVLTQQRQRCVASSNNGGRSGRGSQPPAVTPASKASIPISPAAGGTLSLGGARVEVPPGALQASGAVTGTLEQVTLRPEGVAALAVERRVPVPEGSAFGSAAVAVSFLDAQGQPVELAAPVTISLPYTGQDVETAGGKIAGIRLMRLDGAWVDLGAEVSAGRVRANSTEQGLFALAITLPRPAITGPEQGYLSLDFAPLLEWTVPPRTTQYHLQVAPFGNDGPGIDLIRNTESAYRVAPPRMGQGDYVLLPGMSYTWRVRTSTAGTALGPADAGWSGWTERTFRTPVPSSGSVRAVSPAPAASGLSRTPVIAWNDDNRHIFYYEVQVSRDPRFETSPASAVAPVIWELVHGGVSAPLNSYTVPEAYALEPGTTYHWRVRPRVQGDGTPVAWSPTWSFTTR